MDYINKGVKMITPEVGKIYYIENKDRLIMVELVLIDGKDIYVNVLLEDGTLDTSFGKRQKKQKNRLLDEVVVNKPVRTTKIPKPERSKPKTHDLKTQTKKFATSFKKWMNT